MFPAATKGGGMCQATMPDVCKVPAPPAPPIPVPFPNFAQCPMADASTCTQTVKIENMPVLLAGTEIPISSGDEPGVAGGIISGTFIQVVKCIIGSTIVMMEGKPVVSLTKQTTHNGSSPNAPVGMVAVPSQVMVLVEG